MSNKKNSNYFSKNRIILFSVMLIIIIVFIALFSKFVLDIDFNLISTSLSHSFNYPIAWLWLCLNLMYPIFITWFRIKSYKIKLKEDNIYVQWYDWISFCFINFLINAITPFAMGCEPFNIFWLKSKGVSLQRATIIVSSIYIFYPIGQILITWPSFFFLCSQYSVLSVNHMWKIAFWLTFVGITIDLMLFVVFWTLSYSRRMHQFINIILNFIKRKLKMDYLTREQIKEEFVKKGSFKHEFIAELKKWKQSAFLLIGNLLTNVLYYFAIIFSYKMFNHELTFNVFEFFNYVNVATTANNFIPIPGGEGTLQWLLNIYITNGTQVSIGNQIISSDDVKTISTNAIFIWRIFTYYLLVIGGIVFAPIVIYLSYKNKGNLRDWSKKLESELDCNKFKIGVFVQHNSNNNESLDKSISSIMNQTYQNIEINLIGTSSSGQHNKQIKYIDVHNNKQLGEYILKQGYDYFVFINSTDILKPKYVIHSLKYAFNNDLIISSYEQHTKFGRLISCKYKWVKGNSCKSQFIYQNSFSQFGIVIKASYFMNLLKLHQKLALDSFSSYLNHYLLISSTEAIGFVKRVNIIKKNNRLNDVLDSNAFWLKQLHDLYNYYVNQPNSKKFNRDNVIVLNKIKQEINSLINHKLLDVDQYQYLNDLHQNIYLIFK